MSFSRKFLNISSALDERYGALGPFAWFLPLAIVIISTVALIFFLLVITKGIILIIIPVASVYMWYRAWRDVKNKESWEESDTHNIRR